MGMKRDFCCESVSFYWLILLLFQVRSVMEKYPAYQPIFAKLSYGESQMLDKAFYEEEVKRLCLSFEQQVCFSIARSSIFTNFLCQF